MEKAVFYDRDGVLLQMVYDLKSGTIDTVKNKQQLKFLHGSIDVLKHTKQLGYKNIIISNQPGIGLAKMTMANFEDITKTMLTEIEKQGATIDAQYYCFHHPFAALPEYKKVCDCRKPKSGLFMQAAKEYNIDLTKSWIIGDGVNDIIAGHNAGCKTILLGNILESEYFRILQEQLVSIKPDFIVKKLTESIDIIKK